MGSKESSYGVLEFIYSVAGNVASDILLRIICVRNLKLSNEFHQITMPHNRIKNHSTLKKFLNNDPDSVTKHNYSDKLEDTYIRG